MERASGTELRDYLRFLGRRKWVVLLIVALAVAGSIGLSSVQPVKYAATAEVLLQRTTSELLFDPIYGQSVDREPAVDTEIRVLESQAVRRAVRERLGTGASVHVRPAARTDIIEVRAEERHPVLAAAVANAYAESYIEFRRKQAVDDLFAATEQIERKLADLQRRTETAPTGEAEQLRRVQSLFREELDKLQVTAELRTGGAQILTQATPPRQPFEPRPLRNAVVSLVIGLVLGIAAAVLIEYLDDSVGTRDDLQRLVPAVPVLGVIPAVTGWRKRSDARLVSASDPAAPAAEAYRTLRTAVRFLGMDHGPLVLQVVSPDAEEGKTTTLANLGVALARAGQPVMLVDGDLRKPRLHQFFGLSNAVGLTSVMQGDVDLGEAAQPVPGVDGLFVLASGPLPPSPSEFLSTTSMHALLGAMRAAGYFTLVDSPPVLPVADALVLGRHVDATLLVSFAGRTSRRQLLRTVELLEQMQMRIAGLVLNGATAERRPRYSHGYYWAEAQGSERHAEPTRTEQPRARSRDRPGASEDGPSRPWPPSVVGSSTEFLGETPRGAGSLNG